MAAITRVFLQNGDKAHSLVTLHAVFSALSDCHEPQKEILGVQVHVYSEPVFLRGLFFVAIAGLVFLRGRPLLGIGTKSAMSDRRTRTRPATVIVDTLFRLTRSAIACLETLRVRAASAWEIYSSTSWFFWLVIVKALCYFSLSCPMVVIIPARTAKLAGRASALTLTRP
jgi:hypothetical protein